MPQQKQRKQQNEVLITVHYGPGFRFILSNTPTILKVSNPWAKDLANRVRITVNPKARTSVKVWKLVAESVRKFENNKVEKGKGE